MGEVNLSINGRNFSIACDDGQEQRVLDLAQYIDGRVRDIKASGAASNEVHLFALVSLMLADEVFELRDYIHQNGGVPPADDQRLRQEELAIASAIEGLADRIEGVANRLKSD